MKDFSEKGYEQFQVITKMITRKWQEDVMQNETVISHSSMGRQVTIKFGYRNIKGNNQKMYSVDRDGPTWKTWLATAESLRKEGEELVSIDIIPSDGIQFSFKRIDRQ